jgi:hypothetical protein
MLVVAALLAGCAAAAPAIGDAPSQVWTAPPALSMDAHGLPAPEGGRDGTWLPAPLDGWVLDRLAAYSAYPWQCQARLDAARTVAEARLAEALSARAVDVAADRAELEHEAAESWPTWAVVGAGIVGFVAGGATLYLAAQVVR